LKRKSVLNSFTGVLSIGLTSGLCLVFGLAIGYKADSYFKTEPWGIVLGVVVGLLAGMLESYNQIKKGIEELDRKKNSE